TERAATTEQVIDLFLEKNPEVTISAEPGDISGYFDKLATSVAAGDAPDVMTMGGAYPAEYSAVEAPVSSRIARSRLRRIRCRVRDMGSSFGSRAEGLPPGAAGAARDAAADAAAGWRPQPPCTGPERAGAPGRA